MRFISAFVPLFVLAVLAFLFGVAVVDRAANRTRVARGGVPPTTLPVVDLHSDALLWNRPLLERSRRGHVDLPRLRDGGVVIQVFSATNAFPLGANYRRTPQGPDLVTLVAVCNRWPEAAWRSPVERALAQAETFHRTALASGGRLVPVLRASDVQMIREERMSGTTGGVLLVEGLHGLHGDLFAIDRLFAAGFRVFGLVHMTDTALAGSAHGWHKGGLTTLGRRAVARIDSLGGIVDLAHASSATIGDVLAGGVRRVMVSHAGVDGTCPGNRNLSDDELRGIAAAGGIVGIGFWDGAVCGDDAAAVARAIRHAADVAGVDHVALGSDFDGAVAMPFDASGVQRLVPALEAAGFSDGEIGSILGGNALRFLAESLPRG
ncbi:MAG: membrane dipeptidase [Candidatus Krumholzibacteria bacterium]|nr:membrane dipeptidase [Candidatus Krumholzibacteria bacterium]MDH5269091.1 membrane dipeptidase [Candidatus Krumholzibacteria bacterium]